MTDDIPTRTDLLVAIGQSWAALNAALDRLTETRATTIHDAEGSSGAAPWPKRVVYYCTNVLASLRDIKRFSMMSVIEWDIALQWRAPRGLG